MIVFFVLNVWQNVEVVKIRIEYKKALQEERHLIDRNDRLRYEIEKYKRTDLIEKYAAEKGMKQLTPYDFVTIDMDLK